VNTFQGMCDSDKMGDMITTERRILLFDIDGTLLDPQGEGLTFLRKALDDVYGTAGPIEKYDMAGKTDWQIITDLMRLAGIKEDTIESRRSDAFSVYAQYLEEAVPPLTIRLLPGVSNLIKRILDDRSFIMGLVTGNVRELVPHKLKSASLDPAIFRFGAYGSDHSNRNFLPSLALDRLEGVLGLPIQKELVLVIGDTPHDVACARHAGVKVMCVTTGHFNREELEACSPDYLLDDLGDTEAVMRIFHQF